MFVQTETSIPVRYTNLCIFIFLRTFWPHFFPQQELLSSEFSDIAKMFYLLF